MLRYTQHYGRIEDIGEQIDQARKGRIRNIDENVWMYSYKCNYTLIDEPKASSI
jgi:hypothetical protein